MVMHPYIQSETFRILYPFTSHFVRIGGFKYHYVDEGEGKPVVMVHGNPTWSFYYREVVKALRDGGKRAIAPDHIGCGFSDKPHASRYAYTFESRVSDFTRFMEHLNLNRPVCLVAHDWGGAIAMAHAVRFPETIDKIVVLNTSAFFPPNNKHIPKRLKMIRDLPLFSHGAVLGLNAFARAALYMAVNKPLSRDVKKGLLAPYNNWKNRIATLKFVQNIPLTQTDRSYQAVLETDENLHKLKNKPMMILWGMRDFVFTADYFSEWQRRFPRAHAVSFPHAGHYLLEDEKDTVPLLINRFLSEPAF